MLRTSCPSPAGSEDVKSEDVKSEVDSPIMFSEDEFLDKSAEGFQEWVDITPLTRNTRQLIDAIAIKLEAEIKKNYTNTLPASYLISAYHCVSIPSMSITSYLKRLTDYIDVSPAALIGMMVLLKKSITPINPLTVHRLTLTCLLLAHKCIDDHIYNNAQFSNVGGIDTREMNALEREFLNEANHKIFITDKSFISMLEEILDINKNEINMEKLSESNQKILTPEFVKMYSIFKSQSESSESESKDKFAFPAFKPKPLAVCHIPTWFKKATDEFQDDDEEYTDDFTFSVRPVALF